MTKTATSAEEKKASKDVKQAPLNHIFRCDPQDPEIEYIKSFYGLDQDFPLEQLFTHAESMNKLFLVNKGVSDLLYADQTAQLELVGVGVETFIRNESKFSNTECIFRIH